MVVFDDNYKAEAFMSRRTARLTTHERRLLVKRVRFQGLPDAHVAKTTRTPATALGVAVRPASDFAPPQHGRGQDAHGQTKPGPSRAAAAPRN